jgi:hypothetical protein
MVSCTQIPTSWSQHCQVVFNEQKMSWIADLPNLGFCMLSIWVCFLFVSHSLKMSGNHSIFQLGTFYGTMCNIKIPSIICLSDVLVSPADPCMLTETPYRFAITGIKITANKPQISSFSLAELCSTGKVMCTMLIVNAIIGNIDFSPEESINGWMPVILEACWTWIVKWDYVVRLVSLTKLSHICFFLGRKPLIIIIWVLNLKRHSVGTSPSIMSFGHITGVGDTDSIFMRRLASGRCGSLVGCAIRRVWWYRLPGSSGLECSVLLTLDCILTDITVKVPLHSKFQTSSNLYLIALNPQLHHMTHSPRPHVTPCDSSPHHQDVPTTSTALPLPCLVSTYLSLGKSLGDFPMIQIYDPDLSLMHLSPFYLYLNRSTIYSI